MFDAHEKEVLKADLDANNLEGVREKLKSKGITSETDIYTALVELAGEKETQIVTREYIEQTIEKANERGGCLCIKFKKHFSESTGHKRRYLRWPDKVELQQDKDYFGFSNGHHKLYYLFSGIEEILVLAPLHP